MGLCFAPYGEDLEWPTNEMESRGYASSLIIGLLIAIPSGVGVALSVVSSNTGGLVGVAISASLFPPAVNAGTYEEKGEKERARKTRWRCLFLAKCAQIYTPSRTL